MIKSKKLKWKVTFIGPTGSVKITFPFNSAFAKRAVLIAYFKLYMEPTG